MRQGTLWALTVAACLWLVLPAPVHAQRGRQPVQLSAGAGRELVETACTECHRLNLIVNSWGYTREGWKARFASMVALPDGDADVVAGYLATHFPMKPAPEAVLIPGDVAVTINEWLLPTLGSRPHDPLAARDGSVWWTGQWASKLGRLDPSTGTMTEYPLPADSGPHGLTEDAAGHV